MGLGSSVPTGPKKGAAGRKGAAAAAEADEPETNPIVDIVLGALVHWGYTLRTAFRRARENHAERRAADAATWREDEVEPSMDGHAEPEVERREPSIAPTQRRIHAPVEASFEREPAFVETPAVSPRINARPSYDDSEIDYPEEAEDDTPYAPDAYVPEPAAPPVVNHQQRGDSRFTPVDPTKPRVTAPAPRPAQGQRIVREAQSSFFDESNGGFELPSLSLLAEPKHKGPSPEHAPERLEDMARQLEGVLEDRAPS
jgi:S-DNA-T family DNA segregation ATPase FtsK/SpoIIIE